MSQIMHTFHLLKIQNTNKLTQNMCHDIFLSFSFQLNCLVTKYFHVKLLNPKMNKIDVHVLVS